jgi:hypothetical protein
MKYWKTGTTLEYNAMLDLVETFETTNEQIPIEMKKLVINVCTGVPLDVGNNKPTLNTKPIDIKKGQMKQFKKKIKQLNTALNAMGMEPMQVNTPIDFGSAKRCRMEGDPTLPPLSPLAPPKLPNPMKQEERRPFRKAERQSRPKEKFKQLMGPRKISDKPKPQPPKDQDAKLQPPPANL